MKKRFLAGILAGVMAFSLTACGAKEEASQTEAATEAMSFFTLKHPTETLYAGHHPDHIVSAYILKKLGFEQIRMVFYEPTGLYHPLYTKKQN